MALRTTKLSTIINRMDRYQTVLQNNSEPYKVRDIDEEIRGLKRFLPMPWTLKKGSMRVFDGVYTYAVATDHDELAYLDTSKDIYYPAKARFKYTSLQQFWEDPNNRNQIAEIWDGGQRYLGVNYKNIKVTSQVLNTAGTIDDWVVSDDAGIPTLDEVFFKEGSSCIRFPITNSIGIATIKNNNTAISDSEYKKKYHFKWVYLDAVPTSIEIRLGTDDVNYIKTVVTSQFDGSPFKADQWNLIAHDLNLATAVGTFNSSSIGCETLVFNGAPTGTYYIDASYLRAWELMDYWYYSIYQIVASGGTVATKEYFYNDDDASPYDLNDMLVGDLEWTDCIMYGAMLNNMLDTKDSTKVYDEIKKKRDMAWQQLIEKYPSMDPVIITDRWNWVEDFVSPSDSIGV